MNDSIILVLIVLAVLFGITSANVLLKQTLAVQGFIVGILGIVVIGFGIILAYVGFTGKF